jgi:hypothetical protein
MLTPSFGVLDSCSSAVAPSGGDATSFPVTVQSLSGVPPTVYCAPPTMFRCGEVILPRCRFKLLHRNLEGTHRNIILDVCNNRFNSPKHHSNTPNNHCAARGFDVKTTKNAAKTQFSMN